MMPAMGDAGGAIGAAWLRVRDDIAAACVRAGRAANEVTLVAVSKKHSVHAIRQAMAAGALDLGENYAQELAQKRAELADAPLLRWHFIGSLQRNKVKMVIGCTLLHAVDSEALLREIGKRASAEGVVQDVLLAVNLSGEPTKSGVTAAEVPALTALSVPGVRVRGLMTMPAPGDRPAAQRAFARLRALRDSLGSGRMPYLSMGMSDDYELAIAEGATHVRIGTAIFGARAVG